MPKYRYQQALWLLWSALIIGVDQYTKWLALRFLSYATPGPVIPSLNFTLSYNTGSAFGFLNGAGWSATLALSLVSVAMVLYLLHWLLSLPAGASAQAFALSCIIGGAIGNLWDRLVRGFVVDFIQVYYQQWSWPNFNVADSAICIGVVVLLFTLLRTARA